MTTSTARDDIAWIRQRFGAECVEVRVEGDEPLLLDDPAFVHVTEAPHHQLFCVAWKDGVAVGRREHVALCAPGQLLAGLRPTEGARASLLLSGAAGSMVLRVPTRLLLEALADPRGREILSRLLDGWFELLVSTLPPALVPTRCEALGAGVEIGELVAPVRASSRLVWVALSRPPSRYGGVELGEGDDHLPLRWPVTPTAWLVAEGASARTSGTVELLAAPDGASAVEGFHAFAVALLARARGDIEKVRLERDAASVDAERQVVSDALRQLALVGRGERLAPELGGGDAFEQACHRIAAFLEIPPPAVPRLTGHGLSHAHAAVAELTTVRTRRVLLEGEWWKDDAGALLGFVVGDDEDSLHPVALLPSRGGYEAHDPRSDTPRRVTEEVSDGLHPQAYQFYPPLPDRPLGPLDVLRYSSRRARRDVAFVVLVGLGLGSLSTLIPVLTGQVFDNFIPGAERALLLQLTLVLVLVYVGQGLFDVARGLALVRVQTRMDATLEAGVWDRLLGLPLPFFRRYSSGELASRAAGIGGIREILAGTTLSAMLGGLFSLWNFGFLFVIDPGLAVAATGLVFVAIVPAVLATHFGLRRQRTVAAIDGKIEGLLLELLSGIAKLRVTAAENRAFAVWAKLFARRRDADLGAERVNARIEIFQSIYPIVCSMVLYWMLASGEKQKVSTGLFLAFATAFGTFLGATLQVIEAGLHSLSVIPMYERAKPILTERPETAGTGQRVDLAGGIEVNHVSFRYDPKGPLILDDVSFQVAPDEFVALVGPSGSGKSTLLRLLLGFDTCAAGGVFYDGQALTGLDVRFVRKQIGVVMQNSRVMGGDIYTNIVGSTGLTIDDAWAAARSAALDKDIEAMPMGMHTVITQGGGTLSGGQKQRLMIARALASKPRIVFFDEATSALDNVTQAIVSESLESLRVTRVVIAHRLSTIRHADKIVVLEKGRIAQIGRFEELMAVEGPFRELARRQMV